MSLLPLDADRLPLLFAAPAAAALVFCAGLAAAAEPPFTVANEAESRGVRFV
jgi:hypothetical protein